MVQDRPDSLLDVEGLSVWFETAAGPARALRTIGFSVAPGEIVAIVGESGSGKSTAALSILRLLGAGARIEGKITFKGEDLLRYDEAKMRSVRGAQIGMIFQDPSSALNPVRSIGWQIGEVLRIRNGASDVVEARVRELLALVGIRDPAAAARMYPHQFSGGMRQRAMIAMATACNPSLLIADEPTTALDVTVQERIIELLLDLRRRFSMAILVITHNLGMVARLADKVVVLYKGEIVEVGDIMDVFGKPRHGYTKSLLAAVPTIAWSSSRKARG
ncbi:MAG: ABC transporter ATP-binding protein [Parvibaculaceae bacterium]